MSNFLQKLARAIAADPRELRAELSGGGSMGMPGGRNLYTPTYLNNHPQYHGKNIRQQEVGYITSALTFRAVQYTATALGSAPIRLYKTTDDASKSDEVANHPFAQLMRQPNLGQSRQTFMTFVGVSLCVTGFVVIEKERNLLGETIGLWPMRSDWIKPIPRKGTLPDWEYTVPGERPRILAAKDAIPITYADTVDNSPTGIGPLEAALRNVGLADTLQQFIQNFMSRGAMPMYVAFPSEDPYIQAMWSDQEQADAARAAFRERFGGLHKATDVAIMNGIKDIKPLGFSVDELAFPDLFKLNENAVCQAFGISPIVLNTTGGLEQSSYNNYSSARRSFYEDTINPLWGRVDDAFTRHLLSEMLDTNQYSIQFDTTRLPALREDVNERWKRATDAARFGQLTLNQFLRTVELDTVENGDVYTIPDGVSIIHQDDMVTGAIQKAEAEGDVISATEIFKITGKEPSKEKINRGVDSKSAPDDEDESRDDLTIEGDVV